MKTEAIKALGLLVVLLSAGCQETQETQMACLTNKANVQTCGTAEFWLKQFLWIDEACGYPQSTTTTSTVTTLLKCPAGESLYQMCVSDRAKGLHCKEDWK